MESSAITEGKKIWNGGNYRICLDQENFLFTVSKFNAETENETILMIANGDGWVIMYDYHPDWVSFLVGQASLSPSMADTMLADYKWKKPPNRGKP